MSPRAKTPATASALEEVLAQINERLGPGTVHPVGTRPDVTVARVPTGIPVLDRATDGGFPRGRLTEIYGLEASGKTSVALHAAAGAVERKENVLYVDSENAVDTRHANLMGLDLAQIILAQPGTTEEAFDVIETVTSTGELSMIVVDSMAALVPRAELEGDYGDSVSPGTPIYIRDKHTGVLDIVPIEDLYHGNKDENPNHKHVYTKFGSVEVMTHEGWQDIQAVWKKPNRDIPSSPGHAAKQKRPLVVIRTAGGYVQVTPDHSLFVGGEPKTPEQIEVFDRLDCIEPTALDGSGREIHSIDPEVAWLLGFYAAEGATPRTDGCLRFEVSNTDQMIIDRCQKIVETHFLCVAETRTTSYEPGNPRSDLHILTCSTDPELGRLMQSCLTRTSRSKKVPRFILHGNIALREAFLDGFWEGDGSTGKNGNKRYNNDSLVLLAGLQYMLARNDTLTNTMVHPQRPQQVALREVTKRYRKDSDVLQFYSLDGPDWVYDIATDAGTFVTSLGNIVLHNSNVAVMARLTSQWMRKFIGILGRTQTALVVINQMRSKVGLIYGNPNVTTGGNAIKYYASLRLECAKKETLKKGTEPIGAKIRVKVPKSKVSRPFVECEFDIFTEVGIDGLGSLIDIGKDAGVIHVGGPYLTFGNTKAQGKDKFRDALTADPALLAALLEAIG